MEHEFNANNFLLRLILQCKDGFQVFKIYVILDLFTFFFFRSKILTYVCSDVDATMLACIAFSCPNLESMEIYTSGSAVNRITGYDCLSLFFTSIV